MGEAGRNILTANLAPRGLSREIAARYIGVSPGKFDTMVADRRMPQPRRMDGRKVWDRFELDAAFEALPHEGETDRPATNAWDAEYGDAAA